MPFDPARFVMLTENTPDPSQMHPVEYLEPLDTEELDAIQGATPAAIRALVEYLTPKDPLRRGAWAAKLWQLIAMSHSVIPRTQVLRLSDLAAAAGTSKAVLSFHICQLRDLTGIASHTGKSQGAREAYAERQRAVWRDRRGAGGDDTSEAPQGPHKRTSTPEWACQG
jgi:hypothetical protein